jgi:hypothetical protein
MNNTTTTATWHRSQLAGNYVSDCGRYTAELRAAGFYQEFGCRLTRHYAVRLRGTSGIVGTARTLAEAAGMYL